MTRMLHLEDFGSTDPDGIATAPASASPEAAAAAEDAMDAFDRGYKDGWDDCAREEVEARRRIGAALASGLQDMTMTYQEARQDVLTSLAPLFEDIAAQLLPRLAAEAVAPVVIAELEAIAVRSLADTPELRAAPADLPGLQRLIEARNGPEVRLTAEPAFAEGQVSIRFGSEQRDIDLSDATRHMADAIRAFIDQETAHPDTRAAKPAFQKGVA